MRFTCEKDGKKTPMRVVILSNLLPAYEYFIIFMCFITILLTCTTLTVEYNVFCILFDCLLNTTMLAALENKCICNSNLNAAAHRTSLSLNSAL